MSRSHTTRSTYDLAHRRTSESDALGHKVSRTYDANGNVETVTDAAGGKLEQTVYRAYALK